MQHVVNLKAKSDPYERQTSEILENQVASRGANTLAQEEDISQLVQCMALNSATTSEEDESEVSEVGKCFSFCFLWIKSEGYFECENCPGCRAFSSSASDILIST